MTDNGWDARELMEKQVMAAVGRKESGELVVVVVKLEGTVQRDGWLSSDVVVGVVVVSDSGAVSNAMEHRMETWMDMLVSTVPRM